MNRVTCFLLFLFVYVTVLLLYVGYVGHHKLKGPEFYEYYIDQDTRLWGSSTDLITFLRCLVKKINIVFLINIIFVCEKKVNIYNQEYNLKKKSIIYGRIYYLLIIIPSSLHLPCFYVCWLCLSTSLCLATKLALDNKCEQ